MEGILFGLEPIRWIQELFGLGHPLPFRIFSLLGDTWGILFTVGVALWVYGRETAHAVIGIVVAGAVAKLLLGMIFFQSRPAGPGIVVYEHLEMSSFPSGHVFQGLAPWALLYALGSVRLWVPALVAIVVSLGRLYLGTHYLGDVLGGVIFAAALVWMYHRLLPPIRRWLRSRPDRVYHATMIAVVLGAVGWLVLLGGHPRRYEIAGIAIGGSLGLSLEALFVRYRPESRSRPTRALSVVLGGVGIATFLLLDRSADDDALLLGTFTAGAATLWTIVVAPLLFSRFGWSHAAEGPGHEDGEILSRKTPTPPVRGEAARERGSDRRGDTWHRAEIVGLAVLGGLVALLTYGTVIEPRLLMDVEAQPAPIARLPAQWEGQVIAVTGDFQIGMWWSNTGMIRKVIDRIVEERPAAVLLTGDFIYHAGQNPAPEVATVGKILRPLGRSGIPVFAVLGNHDWGLRGERGEPNRAAARVVREAIEELGITVLHNEAVPIQARGGDAPLYVVGIGSRYADEDRAVDALQGVPDGAPRVVFMHHPDSFELLPAGAAPLAVAGHTHGGQIALPFAPEWSWLTFAREDDVHTDGWIDEGYGAPGNRLYVNRGIGFSVVPIRIGAAPELTFFRLERGQDRGQRPPTPAARAGGGQMP